MASSHESISDRTPHERAGAGHLGSALSEQTHKVSDDVRELRDIAMAGATDALHAVKRRGEQALESARERGQHALEQGRDKAVNARDGFETFVAENPFKSVLIALGIGALAGLSLRRRG